MPRGIRLVAQPGQKVSFKDGQLAAQVFDEGKYKTWYVMDPCPDPEPFSSKDKILPGHNGHVAYAESVDGVNWERPKLGLFEYAGNRSNNIVWRGDLDGSTRGFHGGSVFVDTLNTCYYDEDLRLYVAHVRAWQVNERIAEGQQSSQRIDDRVIPPIVNNDRQFLRHIAASTSFLSGFHDSYG